MDSVLAQWAARGAFLTKPTQSRISTSLSKARPVIRQRTESVHVCVFAGSPLCLLTCHAIGNCSVADYLSRGGGKTTKGLFTGGGCHSGLWRQTCFLTYALRVWHHTHVRFSCFLFYMYCLTDGARTAHHDSCRPWTIARHGRSQQKQVKHDFDSVPVQALAASSIHHTPLACMEM